MTLPVPPGVTLDVERILDRLADRRVAIVAGSWAVLAALLGGIIGSGGVLLAAHITASSEAQDNRTTFVREQQQVTYVQAVQDVRKLEALEKGCNQQQGGPTADSLQEAFTVLQADAAMVELVGSAPGYFKFGHVVDSHEAIIKTCNTSELTQDIKDTEAENMRHFVEQARTDVQGPRD